MKPSRVPLLLTAWMAFGAAAATVSTLLPHAPSWPVAVWAWVAVSQTAVWARASRRAEQWFNAYLRARYPLASGDIEDSWLPPAEREGAS